MKIERDKLTEHVKALVDAAPPLSSEQRERLATLLGPTASGGRRAAA